MNKTPDDAQTSHEQQVMKVIAGNLDIDVEELLADQAFRKEIGAEQLGPLEQMLEADQSAE